MWYALTALLATLALTLATGGAQGGEYDLRARAASASARAELELARRPELVVKEGVCPCSVGGTCPCTARSDCGCISGGKLRWVATSKANQTALYRGNLQIGNWWHAEGEFRMLLESFD